MKPTKIIAIVIAVLILAFFTAPIWGGCNFNSSLCQTWCEVTNSGIDEASCKASCTADKLGCMTK